MGFLETIAVFIVAAFFIVPADVEGKAILKRRDTTNYCSRSTPCGWEVYRPFMRNVELFIKSPCDCQEGTHCIRASDDISISAYVHLCRPVSEEIVVWPHGSYTSSEETDSVY